MKKDGVAQKQADRAEADIKVLALAAAMLAVGIVIGMAIATH